MELKNVDASFTRHRGGISQRTRSGVCRILKINGVGLGAQAVKSTILRLYKAMLPAMKQISATVEIIVHKTALIVAPPRL